MLKVLFTSGSRVEILDELLLNPEPEFYLSQLARNSGTAPILASKELDKLEKIGLVKERKVGKLNFYSINKQSPVYPELRSMFLKTKGLGDLFSIVVMK